MIASHAVSRSKAGQEQKAKYGWIAVAALIVTLIVGLSVAVPRVAAQGEGEPSHFSSQAAAIEYYVGLAERDRKGAAGASFSSQAAAIEYYAGMAERDRAGGAGISFSSQVAAIEYFAAQHQCEREEAVSRSFSSQAAAIKYYLDMARRERLGFADASLGACLLLN